MIHVLIFRDPHNNDFDDISEVNTDDEDEIEDEIEDDVDDVDEIGEGRMGDLNRVGNVIAGRVDINNILQNRLRPRF